MKFHGNLMLAQSLEGLRIVVQRDCLVELEGEEKGMPDFGADVLRTEIIENSIQIRLNFDFLALLSEALLAQVARIVHCGRV